MTFWRVESTAKQIGTFSQDSVVDRQHQTVGKGDANILVSGTFLFLKHLVETWPQRHAASQLP